MDKGYDYPGFVAALRSMSVTPHVAQNTTARRSAIDVRTTRHPGYAVSQRKRKLVEQAFGWMKTVGGMRKLRHRGGPLVELDVHLQRRRVQHRPTASVAARYHVSEVGQAVPMVTHVRPVPLVSSSLWPVAVMSPPIHSRTKRLNVTFQ